MAGSRQNLTCSFMRACLRCLTVVDTDVLRNVPAAVVIVVLLLRLVVVLPLPLCTKKLKKRKVNKYLVPGT